MPIFKHKGQQYNVDEADIKDFASEFPDAYTVAKDKDGVTYRVASGDWESFQQKPVTPKEAYHNQPQPELEEKTKSKEERSQTNNSTGVGGPVDIEGTIAAARQTADFAGSVAGGIKAKSENPFPSNPSATDLDAFKTPEQKAEENYFNRAGAQALYYLQAESQLNAELQAVEEELAALEKEYYQSEGYRAVQTMRAMAPEMAQAGLDDFALAPPRLRELQKRRTVLRQAKEHKAVAEEISKNKRESGTVGAYISNAIVGAKSWLADKANSMVPSRRSGEALVDKLVISRKLTNGDTLSPDEQDAWTIYALEDMMEGRYGKSKEDFGYIAGYAAPMMVEFMAELAMSPGKGLATGAMTAAERHAAKATRWLIRKYGVSAVRNTLRRMGAGIYKQGARLAGATANAAIAAHTVQADDLVKGTMERMAGTAVGTPDEEGNLVGTGVKDAKDFGQAYYEQAANMTIENLTEAIFEGAGIGKGFKSLLTGTGKKIAGTKVGGKVVGAAAKLADTKTVKAMSEFIEKTKSSNWYQSVSKLKLAGHLGSIPEEMMEEYAAIPLRHWLGVNDGEQGLMEELTSRQTFYNTAAGLSLGMGAMIAVQAVPPATAMAAGAVWDKYNMFRTHRNLIRRDKEGQNLFGAEWESVKTQIESFTEENFGEGMDALVEEFDSPEKKDAAWRYAQSLQQDRGFNTMRQKAKEEGESDPLADAREEGYEAEDPQQIDAWRAEYDRLHAKWGSQVEEAVAQYGGLNLFFDILRENPDGETAMREILRYYELKERIEGAEARKADEAETDEEALRANVARRTNQETGKIVTVNILGDNGQPAVDIATGEPASYYVINGATDTGDGNVALSDGMVVLRDADGNRQALPGDKLRLVSVMQPEQIIAEEQARASQEAAAPVQEASPEPAAVSGNSADIAAELDKTEEGRGVKEQVDVWFAQGEEPGAVEQLLSSTAGSFAPLGMDYYNALAAEAAANAAPAAEPANAAAPAEGVAEASSAPTSRIMRKKGAIDAEASFENGATAQEMADAYMQEYGDEEGLALSTAQGHLTQVQEERQTTKDIDRKNGPLRKQEKFWSDVVDLLTPKEETVAEVAEDSIRFDNQGNPIDESGRLILEEVESIDQISDQDFEDPTRNIILPAIPDNVAEAVGTNGKPVIIKKNIFERNLIRHSDLTPDQSRDILKSALYSHDIYGQNQKRRRVNNWVVISVSDKQSSGTNKLVLLEVNENKENVEIVHWHYLDKRGMEKLKRQTEREGGQLLILPSASAEEVGALSDLTSDLPSEGKGTDKSVTAEGTAEEISENAQNATQSEQNELEKAEKERIDALVPTIEDVKDGIQTADEFVAGLFGNGIRITPESFRKETGLGWEEQRRLVGIIAGKEKGGLTVEQAAETIVENYRAELAERGFSGDSMEMCDMVIDILSSGNPRAYAKQAAARRAEQALHREMEAFDRYTQEAFHMSAEEYIMYEESMLPKYIEQYKDFDEQEYYSNFADEQSTQNEHDTTRESAETGGSREILSEEQPSATPGEGAAGEGQQGGTLQGDVQGDAQEGLARAEAGQEVADKPTEKESRTRFSTSMFEDAERIAREEQRRAPLRRTARAWEKILGVKVTLMERLEDVKNPVARREIEADEKKGKKVPGWYSDTEGVFLYLPHVKDVTDVDKTCVHEIVSHKGLKELLGQEKFDELCLKVWDMMTPAERKEYMSYPNVETKLQAADEYIAHLSEEVSLNARERSVWQKIMDFIADLLGSKADNRSKAASILGKETLSGKDIAELVRLSYAEYLQRKGNATEGNGVGEARFSVKKSGISVPADEYAKIAHQIATYPHKSERGHVFTDNYYYLCTDIDEDGNFRIVASLRIEGNEELINRLRGKDGQRNFKALEGAEDIAATIEEIKRRGGRANWNIPSSKRQSRTNGRNDSVHLGQQTKPRRNQRPSDKNDGQSESRFKINDKDNEVGGIRFRTLPNERLRKLDEGETCNIERVFTQQKMFNFSSGEKIESYEDVAYIFRSLEDEAVENAFVALVKNGKPTIVHLGMGTATQSTVDQQAVIVAVERIKPDAVYLVHNHPSGNLKASRQDAMLLDSMKKAYGDIVKDGIIINLRSGKYSVFNEEGSKIEDATPNAPEKVTAVKTYSFSKRVFDKDFDVEELMHVTGADTADAYAREHGLVAALTSSQRLGERGKLSLLVISQGSKIVGNVFLNHTEVLPSNLGNISKEIAYYVSAMGGQAGILYGRFGINETRHLGGAVNRASAGSVRMLDAISMTEFGGYVSALDEGVMEETPSYGEGETRFRVTDDKPADAIRRAYDGEMITARFLTKETMVDYLASVEALLDTIAEKTGKGITDPQNVYRAMLTLTNKNTQELAAFDYGVLPHLTKAIAGIMGKEWNGDWDAPEAATLQRYAKVKHGIERDRDMAVRRAIPRMAEQKYKEQFGELDRMIAAETDADARDALRTKKAAMLADPKAYGMQTADEIAEQMEQQWYGRIAEIRRGEGTWREKQQRMDAAIADVFGLDAEGLETYGLTLTEDYSGMTETLIAEGETDRKTARKVSGAVRAAAYDFVEKYEERTGADKTDALWDGVRAVSAYSLEKQRSTGLVDAKYVEDCNRRYEFYVPLRNFAETTADEVYDYLDETYNDNNPVKTARGRRSEAGNPFSNVMMLGYQSITAGNKNAAVQHFWNLANRSDVKGFLVPSRLWNLAELDDAQREEVNEKLGSIADTTGDVILPRIPENATAQQVLGIISDFEDVMKDLKKRGLAFQGKKRARQEYRLTSKQQENAHRVKVYVNGEARYVTIVGDPRAALALNGKLNPESGVPEKYKAMQQFLSGAFTSQNPSFALANIIRDTQHANMRAFITESGKYWAKFSAKQAAMMKPGRLAFLLAKYENSMGNTGRHGWGGELDMRNETHRNFKRFMELGGATGYTFSHKEIENLKKLADMAERAENKTPKGQGYVVGEIFDFIRLCSESAELINRFAAFEASLEAGRSEQRAISDAQEITLNFSRKGAGKKTYNANRKGKTWLESRKYNAVNAIAWLSQFGRDHIIFWNATVQGSYQTYKMIMEHPAKTTFALGGVPIALSAFALPALNAVICAFIGDDEDAYYDELPDYVRQRNLCIKNPLGRGWLKIPLDPATQKVWAAGDAIGAAWRGKRQIDYWGDLGANAVGLFSPVDIYWGDRNDNLSERALSAATSFTPTLIQPLLHSYANRDWKGKPLYNDSRYIDQLPSYAKSFKSDKESLKALSKFLNDVGNSDADSYGRTWHDFATPGVMEELLYGYTGGYGQLALAAVEGAIAIVSDDAKGNFRWDNMPVVNRLWVEGDPGQTRLNIYRNYRDTAVDFMENVEQRRSQINREYNEAKRSHDTLAQAEALTKMKQLHDGDYQRYEILNNSDKLFQKYMKGSRIEDVPDFVIKGMLEAIEIVNNPDGEKEEKKSENDK